VTNLPLLEKVAKTGKKVILSSGMSSWAELDDAVGTLKSSGCLDLVVLQCTSEYPCPPEKSGLNVIQELKQRYGVPVGFSDHTLGLAVPLAAYIKGATLIEKHFTLSTEMYGSDAKNSTEPAEFRQLVCGLRDIEAALSNAMDKDQEAKDLSNMKHVFEKSVVSIEDISKGDVLTEAMLSVKKPGGGIPAKYMRDMIGKRANVDISIDRAIQPSDLVDFTF
jgi:sialic acid synthase SpsE